MACFWWWSETFSSALPVGKGDHARRMFADREAGIYILVNGDSPYNPGTRGTRRTAGGGMTKLYLFKGDLREAQRLSYLATPHSGVAAPFSDAKRALSEAE